MNNGIYIEIDTEALRHNLSALRSAISPATDIMAVVKDDCYGHSSDICVPVLLQAGITMLAVATIEHASKLRQQGITARIALLTTPLEHQFRDIVALGIEPLISNQKTAEILSQIAEGVGTKVHAHCYVDTGMARNGAAPHDVANLLSTMNTLPGITIQGFSSHFATSDEPNSSFAQKQLATFDALLRQALLEGYSFPDIHIANSGGILNFPESHYTLVRPGLAMYGYHPTQELQSSSGLLPVMALRTVISSLRTFPAGTSVSYGCRYHTTGSTTIATLPIGYGSGLHRALTNKMQIMIRGKHYPAVGTICMDETMADLGLAHSVSVGDEAVILGQSGTERITAWDIASSTGTIPYEILTSFGFHNKTHIACKSTTLLAQTTTY